MYVILLFVFNAVSCGYLREFFMDFVGFLSMVIQVVLFYIHNVEGIIFTAPDFQILEYQLVYARMSPLVGIDDVLALL